ncbi:hypothetical protein RUM43_009946 [Polyplax serrata]|uniref:Uncharacterized protein n=1 Tax=Polyplax serrata TaxID=468196 RepID=A0AAN8PK27_POLSC
MKDAGDNEEKRRRETATVAAEAAAGGVENARAKKESLKIDGCQDRLTIFPVKSIDTPEGGDGTQGG